MHGHQFVITGTEGVRQPRATWGPNNTVLVGVAQSRNVEFLATNPGDWMIHCHMPHHMMNQMSSMAGPMTRRAGMPAGAGMEEGMGMLRGGAATAAEHGPSMGRGMGVGSALAQPTANGTMTPQSPVQSPVQPSVQSSSSQQAAQGMGGMQMGQAEVSKDANSVPGFPQDAFMESPAMAMDAMVEKPETHGLRPGWSGYMQGMMTLIRVLSAERYEEIERLREARRKNGSATMPGMDGPSEKR
jgi:hypothetical protein